LTGIVLIIGLAAALYNFLPHAVPVKSSGKPPGGFGQSSATAIPGRLDDASRECALAHKSPHEHLAWDEQATSAQRVGR